MGYEKNQTPDATLWPHSLEFMYENSFLEVWMTLQFDQE